ncbi:putative GNAT family acetyltransferase [Thozetella sp. PMI_491]|nr:putative GNAT family acetyltransferase [Thozetella sp. PMI_491]
MAAMPVSLEMRLATGADAPRIAEIHMAAFSSNAMLHAQFPTPEIRQGLQRSVEAKARADIDDPRTTVLVVLSSAGSEQGDGIIISFAKWCHPVLPGEDYVEPDWIWPEGTDLTILDAWTAKTQEAQRGTLGDTPCYRLTFIGTDPAYNGRGAASLLLKWGIAQSNLSRWPIYLESTVEAVPFYRKHGMAEGETISFPTYVDASGNTEIYSETVFTYRTCP